MKLSISGNPIAKKRPRFARMGKFVKTYKDTEEQTSEGKVFLQIKEQCNRESHTLTNQPVIWRAKYFFPRPKSHYGTGKNSTFIKASAPVYHVAKPDLDNLDKFYKDVCNGIIWSDDSVIIKSESEKFYTHADIGYVEIYIDSID